MRVPAADIDETKIETLFHQPANAPWASQQLKAAMTAL
jgi:hypothetical protein